MKNGMSIKAKVAISTIVFMAILTAAIAAIGYKLYHDSVKENIITYTDTVLEYAYLATFKYSFGDMIADRDMPEEYEILRSELNLVKECSDIEYLYAIYFEDIDDIHSLHYAINAKTQAELSTGKPLSEIYSYMGRPCEEGEFADDTLLTLQQAVKDRKRESGTLEGYSDEYGHMLNGYRVIFDSNDRAVGLICVESDINRINIGVHQYVQMVVLTATTLTAAIILLYLFNTKYYLIGPIERIVASSDSFVKRMQSNAEPEELTYEDAHIKTGGELRLLADNVKSLADGVASYMTNLKAATSEKERIATELALAAGIQSHMLPNAFPAFPGHAEFDIYATMDPAKEVGGDFYDFFLIGNDHLGLVVADVSGKGIPAALFMMLSKTMLKTQAQAGAGIDPARVLMEVNNQLSENNTEDMFVTAWLGILEISTGKLTYADAGHEKLLLYQNGEWKYLPKAGGVALALFDPEDLQFLEPDELFCNQTVQMKPGDVIFQYTDGITEAKDAGEELFGEERLLAAMNSAPSTDPTALLPHIRKKIDEFVGMTPQFDDITMLGLRYQQL